MTLSRRSFLGTLPALSVFLWSGPAPAQTVRKKTMINRFSVAGFQYYQGATVIDSLRKGDALRLVAEPANPYDAFAVEIYAGGTKLGYVPRSDNRHISRMLLNHAELACEVEEVDASTPWRSVKVQVAMESTTSRRRTRKESCHGTTIIL